MAKRFIDTDIFKKKSIRSLEAPYKLLYIYLFTDCNHAGIWEVDLEVAGIRLGATYDEKETVKKMAGAITVFDNGSKWFLNSFIEFQYGELNPSNRAHKSVLDQLSRYPELTENKPLTSPLQGCKDKDMDKDKVMDKEMDKEEADFEILQWPSFSDFWEAYDKKRGDKDKLKKKWDKIPQAEKEAIMDYIPRYLAAVPDKQFRKDPQTFLNNKSWNDEIIENGKQTTRTRQSAKDIMPTPDQLGVGEHSKFKYNPAQ